MSHPVAYASVRQLANYLGGSSAAVSLLSDADTLLLALEGASQRMESYIGGRSFGPVQQTRTYNTYLHPWQSGYGGVVGPQGFSGGGLVNWGGFSGETDIYLARGEKWSDWLWPEGAGGGAELELNNWLLSSSVVSLAPADGSSPTVLAPGATADYELVSENSGPVTSIRLTRTRASAISGGAWSLSIAGTWGYEDSRRNVTTLAGNAASGDATVKIAATDFGKISAGQTLWIDTEQVYVNAEPSSQDIPVDRGINGTTAASHLTGATVALVRYNADATWTALELARSRYRNKDMGPGETVSGPDGGLLARPAAEEPYLRRLDALIRQESEGAVPYGIA